MGFKKWSKLIPEVYLFSRSVNIVDVIQERLEKYASNLEELVDQRTQQLVQEKQKSDKLLYRMLPRYVRDNLVGTDQ